MEETWTRSPLANTRWLQWGHGDEAVEEVGLASLQFGGGPLQWGHGDEAVEEGDLLTTNLRPYSLQWGHGDEAVEETRRNRRPSHRPRSFNGATAMKPWKRGGIRLLPRRLARLQWGHGDEAVEEGPPPEPFGAKDLGPGLREGRPAGVSNRSRSQA